MEINQAELLKVITSFLDFKYLENWVKKLNVERYFKELRKIDLEKHL